MSTDFYSSLHIHKFGGGFIVANLFTVNFFNTHAISFFRDRIKKRNIRKRLPEIPHYRVGKRLLFKKSELDLWMENHRENGEQLDLKRTAEEALEKIRGDYPDN